MRLLFSRRFYKAFAAALALLCFSNGAFAARYIFFLHNMYLELFGPESAHKEYGKVEYAQVLAYFRKEGFTVISEMRPRGTDGDVYAVKVAHQVDSLLKKGVSPDDITVVGTSKGGYIAQVACGRIANPRVSYVFIGSCSGEAGLPGVIYSGRILSIYEHSDDIGRSCRGIQTDSRNKVTEYREIELNTGLKHGFLYKALPAWLEPSVKWARHEKL